MRYIQVSIPRSPLGPLTYSVPDEFPEVSEGARVLVPLGARYTTAFVVDTDADHENIAVRSISDVIDSENLFSPALLELTRWMADYYLADWASILKAALPPALDIKTRTLISITEKGLQWTESDPILQILALKKTISLEKLYEMFGHRGTYSRLRTLQQKRFVEIAPQKKTRRAGYNMVEMIESSEPPSAAKELELYNYLKEAGSAVWVEDLRARFRTASRLVSSLAREGRVRCFWVPAAGSVFWPELHTVKELNAFQKKAVHAVSEKFEKFGVFLLHGVTGSGKTEVYLRLASDVLNRGGSVLILVPEIALLPLIARRAQHALKRSISILHSELGERERLEEWTRVKNGEVRVVIGTRSAIFAPLQDLGLIIIDEEHEATYKQGEYPRYHAREGSIMRAKFEKCPILLGSATPSIESYYNAGNGKYQYLSLPGRVEEKPMPFIQLVDMKEEYKTSGDPIFSRLLLKEIADRLKRNQQALVLQNRRGYSPLLVCRDCGTVLECPKCSVTLTYHKGPRRMRCHYCDYSRIAPSKCEKCSSPFIHFFGFGTEKITELMRKHFSEATVERLDRDNTRKKGSLTRILSRFANRQIDILVGTQILAKGHDFPEVTLVGVLGADTSIGIPDFRSTEKLFQLITQVAGRSGRGSEAGTVILQTFHPDHYAIQCSLHQNYADFYEKEIRFRRLMQYPPFVALANLIFSAKDSKVALNDAREFAKLVLAFKTPAMKMLGPAVAPLARLAGLYRFQILVKSPARKALRDCIRQAQQHFTKDKKRSSQLSIDIDPQSIV